MKKYIFTLLAFAMLTGCSKVFVKNYKGDALISYRESQKMNLGLTDLGKYVIYFEKGDTLPLRLAIDTDFIGLKDKKIDLLIKKKIYLSFTLPDGLNKKALEGAKDDPEMMKRIFQNFAINLSSDGIHWTPIQSMPGLKEIFGFSKGRLSFGFFFKKEQGLAGQISLQTLK